MIKTVKAACKAEFGQIAMLKTVVHNASQFESK